MSDIFGVNIIGHLRSNVSLGITARHFAKLLSDRNISLAGVDVSGVDCGAEIDLDPSIKMLARGQTCPYPVNLFCVSLSSLPRLFLKQDPHMFSPDRLNVGLLWYEVTHIPEHYAEALSLFDVLLCGSGYVENIFNLNLRNSVTVRCKHPIYLPPELSMSREDFGLSSDSVVYVFSFDPHHDVDRKNPYSVVEAFLVAFPKGDEKCSLVIKINNFDVVSPSCDPTEIVRKLMSLCGKDKRIKIICRSMTYLEVINLYSVCDVFVSLHRSEGLGLGMLEAMLLGKPVIATAWSGNMSFMNRRNSCLVGYDLVPYSGYDAGGLYQLRERARWAEPRVEEAAGWMRALFYDPTLRARVGVQARVSAVRYQEQAREAEFVDELKEIREQFANLGIVEKCRWKEVGRLRESVRRVRYAGMQGPLRWIRDSFDRQIGWKLRCHN